MDKTKLTLESIRATYTEEKKAIDRMSGFWGYRVMRPLSFYPTWFFIKLGISANKISVLNIIFLLVGCSFIVTGNVLNVLIGSVLLNVYFLLDYVDGNVARYMGKSGSRLGVFLERLSTLLDKGLIPVCSGVAVYYNFNIEPFREYRWTLIFLGVWTSVVYLLTPSIRAYFQDTNTVQSHSKYGLVREYKMLSAFPFYKIVRELLGGTYLFILLVCAVFNQLFLSVLLQTIIATAGLGMVLLSPLVRFFNGRGVYARK